MTVLHHPFQAACHSSYISGTVQQLPDTWCMPVHLLQTSTDLSILAVRTGILAAQS